MLAWLMLRKFPGVFFFPNKEKRNKQVNTKVIEIHPLGTMNIWGSVVMNPTVVGLFQSVTK